MTRAAEIFAKALGAVLGRNPAGVAGGDPIPGTGSVPPVSTSATAPVAWHLPLGPALEAPPSVTVSVASVASSSAAVKPPELPRPDLFVMVAGSRDYTSHDVGASAVAREPTAFEILHASMTKEHIPMIAVQGVGSYSSKAEERIAAERYEERLADSVVEAGDMTAPMIVGVTDPSKPVEHIVSSLSGGGETGLAARSDEIVAAIKDQLARRLIRPNANINLVGHSRGAVVVLEAAHALSLDPETKDLKLVLFLNDPVPGPGNEKAIHGSLSPNVRHCYYYDALETSTPGFANIPLEESDRVTRIAMPDVHSGSIKGVKHGASLMGNVSKQYFVDSTLYHSLGAEYREGYLTSRRELRKHMRAAGYEFREARKAPDPGVHGEMAPSFDAGLPSVTVRGINREKAYGGSGAAPISISKAMRDGSGGPPAAADGSSEKPLM